PSELDASVTARVPTRTNRDGRYFNDKFQAMPLHGYTRMFERMLAHPIIKIMLNTDYREVQDILPWHHMIYTGQVDAFFGYKFGKLPYRSLRFEHTTLQQEQFLPVGTSNFPNECAHTRVSEFKHPTGQTHAATSIVREYPFAEGDPYYPVPRPENAALYKQYEAEADNTPGVSFVGRLATYRYYNMDQVAGQALAAFKKLQQAEEDSARSTLAEAGRRAPTGLMAEVVS
ncbi:MAG: UDP-galactopyranose mutase, partial [Bdellovibrionales bacterium]|nr:UDP-galactopyranose mutase [Ramlibacter sp.]